MVGRHGVGGAPRLLVTWHRCVIDGFDHAVTDEEFTWGASRLQGRYGGVCGHLVAVDSMLLPPAPPCPRCRAVLRANAAERAKSRRSARRLGRIRRLFRRMHAPAVSRTLPTPTPARDGRTPTPAKTGSAPTAPVLAGHHNSGAAK